MIDATGVVVFAATYALISSRRSARLGLDRASGALLGAVACVVCGVLSPGDAVRAVNGPTILLLFGVMGIGAFLALDGFFDAVEGALVRVASTPRRMLGALVWGAGVLSAFLTNDAVCVLGAPLVARLVRRHALPPLPFLLALATGANTGSVATLVGNPQNMLCAMLGGLSYRDHLVRVGPLALVCLAVNHGVLLASFRRALGSARLGAAESSAPRAAPLRVTLSVLGATAVAFTMGADLAWAATAGFAVLLVVHRRDAAQLWGRIDWPLLVFFSGLFVAVEGFVQSGAPAWWFGTFPLAAGADGGLAGWAHAAVVFLIGSNVVSNVPFILVVQDQMASLPDPRLGWEILVVASTFAGNLTLLGSVANIIVAESARDLGGIGFLEHLRVGLPVALITTAIGVVWLVALGPA